MLSYIYKLLLIGTAISFHFHYLQTNYKTSELNGIFPYSLFLVVLWFKNGEIEKNKKPEASDIKRENRTE